MAWGWLGWVALVPLLTLAWSQARPRRVYLSAWFGGLVFFWPALQWMRVADYRMYFTWGFLATFCSLFFPLALYLIRLLGRHSRLPFFVTVPVVWTALEFFRSFVGTGFPWYLLAHTQHDHLAVIQVADLTGAWGISFLVAAVNAFLCQVLLAGLGRAVVTRRTLLVEAGLLVVMLVGVVAYGDWRMGQLEQNPGPRIAIVQGNLPQYLRNNPTTGRSILDHYVSLCDLAARSRPDLIVWPETSMPYYWEEVWPDGPTRPAHELARQLAERVHSSVLLGLNSVVVTAEHVDRRYNSALLLDPRGVPVARYDKIHRVPFGEYVPLRDVLPFLNWFAPYDFDYSVSPGAAHTRFQSESRQAPFTFGVVICYEDTDPDMTRPYAGGDGRPPADFLLNTSNDGWFDGTSEHEEHLAICRFRAVECRRPIARAVNMGISALIDGNGNVLAPQPSLKARVPSGVLQAVVSLEWPEGRPAAESLVLLGFLSELVPAAVWEVGPASPALPCDRWGDYKKTQGVLEATMPLDTRTSFYARCGDWLPWSCWGLLGVCGVAALRRRPARVAIPSSAA
jgi:apolipoprotein N-acyltransferase